MCLSARSLIAAVRAARNALSGSTLLRFMTSSAASDPRFVGLSMHAHPSCWQASRRAQYHGATLWDSNGPNGLTQWLFPHMMSNRGLSV